MLCKRRATPIVHRAQAGIMNTADVKGTAAIKTHAVARLVIAIELGWIFKGKNSALEEKIGEEIVGIKLTTKTYRQLI